MKRTNEIWLTATLASVLLAGCLLVGPDRNHRVVAVHAGASFGECLGYCWTELRVAPDSSVFEAIGYGLNEPLPTLYDSTGTEGSFWAYVASLAGRAPIEVLQEVYGCPDCADGGAEWVEFVYNDASTRRVTFEYGDPPQALAALADTLRTVRETFRNAID